MTKRPNSRVNLDKAINRFAGSARSADVMRNSLANVIVAQKLHGATAPNSRRAHDLIDLQLILARNDIDIAKTADICRRLFAYRRVHAWPPAVSKGEGWETVYDGQRTGLPVLETVEAAVEWCNGLVARIDAAK